MRQFAAQNLPWIAQDLVIATSRTKVIADSTAVMNIILTKTPEDGPQTECAIICIIIMAHLHLARFKSENDSSTTKVLSRRHLFVEARALQERLRKLNRKREVDEFGAFDKQMETAKISNALRCFSGNAKCGVISTSNKVIIKKTAPYSTFYKKSTLRVRKPDINT